MRAWILRDGRTVETTTDWIFRMKRARQTGARIMARALAEGAFLLHGDGTSRFVRRDPATGYYTSGALSDGLKAEIHAHREELRLWAAEERADFEARDREARAAYAPPRLGSSSPEKTDTGTPAVAHRDRVNRRKKTVFRHETRRKR